MAKLLLISSLPQNVCIEMNRQAGKLPSSTVIASQLLRWSRDDECGDLHNILRDMPGNKFDVVLAADCLFFEDFHLALIDTILIALGCLSGSMASASTSANVVVGETIAVGGSVVGVCWLLQPSRSQSMERFVEMANKYFHITIIAEYNSEVCVNIASLF